MKLVLDASAAYDLLEEGTCSHLLIGAQELLAPDLIVAELLNARWKVMRASKHAPSLDRIVGLLERLRLEPMLPYAEDAALLAERMDHSVYDCVYVGLAQREGAKFLTVDKRLIDELKAARLGNLLLGKSAR